MKKVISVPFRSNDCHAPLTIIARLIWTMFPASSFSNVYCLNNLGDEMSKRVILFSILVISSLAFSVDSMEGKSILEFSHPDDPAPIKLVGKDVLIFDNGLAASLQDYSVNLLKCNNSDQKSMQDYEEYSKLQRSVSRNHKTKRGGYNSCHTCKPVRLEAFDDKTLLVMYDNNDLNGPDHLIKFYYMEDGSYTKTEIQRKGGQCKMICVDKNIFTASSSYCSMMGERSVICCATEEKELWSKTTKGSRGWSCLSLINTKGSNDCLAAASDGLIDFIDVQNGDVLSQMEVPTKIRAICDLGNGVIACGGGGTFWSTINEIFIYEVKNNKKIKTLSGHQNRIKSLVKLEENYLISSSDDKTIKIWDVLTGTCIATFQYSDIMNLRIKDENTLQIFGGNELYQLNASWLLSQILLKINVSEAAEPTPTPADSENCVVQ